MVSSKEIRRRVFESSSFVRRIVKSARYQRIRYHIAGLDPGALTDVETPEPLADKELAELIGRPDPVIIEIGANDGSDTIRFLRLFRRGTVYAFEPDPRAAEKHRARVADPRAILFPMAISDVDGVITFHQSGGSPPRYAGDDDWNKSGSIHAPTGHLDRHPGITFDSELEVPTKRLDSWATESGIGDVDFIWADVQGAERNLIMGGLATLRRTRFFYTEYSNEELYENQIDLEGILNLLPEFRVLELYPGDVLLENTMLS